MPMTRESLMQALFGLSCRFPSLAYWGCWFPSSRSWFPGGCVACCIRLPSTLSVIAVLCLFYSTIRIVSLSISAFLCLIHVPVSFSSHFLPSPFRYGPTCILAFLIDIRESLVSWCFSCYWFLISAMRYFVAVSYWGVVFTYYIFSCYLLGIIPFSHSHWYWSL